MATVVDNLSCICGNKTVCKSVVEVDGMMVNQLYCYECGIIMKSPASIDVDGMWLIKHWHEIHERETEKNCCHTGKRV